MKDMYGNIADALTDDNRCAVDHLYRALEIAGVKANTIAMRGGTDPPSPPRASSRPTTSRAATTSTATANSCRLARP